MLTKHDFATNPLPQDLSAEDLTGADLSGADLAGFDAGGDMIRTTWTDKSFSTTNMLWSVWSNGNSLVYAVGKGNTRVSSVSGSAFAQDASGAPVSSLEFLGISGVSTGPPGNPLYIAGRMGTIWSCAGAVAAGGGTWSAESTANTGTSDYSTIWVAPDGTVFACGNQFCKKKSGGTWSDITGAVTDQVYGLWGWKTTGGYAVFAVGAGGKIWKSTGTAFTSLTSGLDPTKFVLYGVYGFSDTDVYAVGEDDTAGVDVATALILHSVNGSTWIRQTVTGVPRALNAVAGASADEVYAVGDNGTVLHKYGAGSSTWTKETLGLAGAANSANYLAVWASASEIWAVGAAGAIIKK